MVGPASETIGAFVDLIELESEELDGGGVSLAQRFVEPGDTPGLHEIIIGEEPDPRFRFAESNATIPMGNQVCAAKVCVETSIAKIQTRAERINGGFERFKAGVIANVEAKSLIRLGG